jgi:hypothetical protein
LYEESISSQEGGSNSKIGEMLKYHTSNLLPVTDTTRVRLEWHVGACGRDGRCIQNLSENRKERGHLEDIGLGGRVTLKLMINEYGEKRGLDSSGSNRKRRMP